MGLTETRVSICIVISYACQLNFEKRKMLDPCSNVLFIWSEPVFLLTKMSVNNRTWMSSFL